MSRWKPNFTIVSQMYSKLLDESPISPPPEEVNSPASEYKKCVGYRMRKSIVLAFNIVQLVVLLGVFVYIAVMDFEQSESMKSAQIILLLILPAFILIQLVGFMAAIRESIMLTTIYWTFTLIAVAITIFSMLIPMMIDIEDGILSRKVRDFFLTTAESIVVGWFLYDLYQLRKLRKQDIQMRPMAMP